MNPLDGYFINQSHNPGKLTFVNATFWEKRAAILKLRLLFNSYPPHTILREVSRVSSLILRAKPWLAKKVLRHGNRFAARIRRRCFRRKRGDDRKWVCCSQLGYSAPFSQKTYHKDMTMLSRRSRQLLCHQWNRFPLRLQKLPVKGEISPEESLLLLMKNYLRICHKTANLKTEIRKCPLIAKQILLETPSASYFALHLLTYLHHYE